MSTGERLYQLRFSYAGKAAKAWSKLSTGGEEGLLLSLYENEGEILAGILAQNLGLTSGRSANILKQLEKKGMVRRREGQDDKRKVYVSLTENGRSYIESIRDSEIREYEQALEKLPPEEVDAFLTTLEKILANI